MHLSRKAALPPLIRQAKPGALASVLHERLRQTTCCTTCSLPRLCHDIATGAHYCILCGTSWLRITSHARSPPFLSVSSGTSAKSVPEPSLESRAHPKQPQRASRTKPLRTGFMACSGAKAPPVSHHSSAIAANFSSSAARTEPPALLWARAASAAPAMRCRRKSATRSLN